MEARAPVRRWLAPAAAPAVRAAWQRRVARIGSLIQVGFAALWLGRGILAIAFPGRLPLVAALVAGTLGTGVWWGLRTAGTTPRPTGHGAAQLERAITLATVIQLVASFGLPVAISAAGRPDLIVATVAVTTGLLLLWLWATLRTPGLGVAGTLLVIIPIGLALWLSGDALTAATGLATGALLLGSAAVGVHWLRSQPGRSVPDCGLVHQPARSARSSVSADVGPAPQA